MPGAAKLCEVIEEVSQSRLLLGGQWARRLQDDVATLTEGVKVDPPAQPQAGAIEGRMLTR